MKHLLLAALIVLLSACVSTGDNTPEASEEDIARINLQLGIEYLRQNKPEIALQRLQQVLDVQPDNATAHSVAALAYTELQDMKAADKHYRKAMQLTPQDSAAFGEINNNYGVFLCSNKLYAEADRYFQMAISTRLYRTAYAALENAGICAEQKGDYSKAEEYYRKALQQHAKLPRSLLGMARLQNRNKHYLKTRAFMQRFHEDNAATAESLWLSLEAERGLGNDATANKLVQELLAKFPESDKAALIKK